MEAKYDITSGVPRKGMTITKEQATKIMTESQSFREKILAEIDKEIRERAKLGYNTAFYNFTTLTTEEVKDYVRSEIIIREFDVNRKENRLEIKW